MDGKMDKFFERRSAYVIAEIGNNHGGDLNLALAMIEAAARSGCSAVKFQKRNNKKLYTKDFYSSPYNSVNSFGSTYGEHRDNLEFNRDQYSALKKLAKERGLDFIVTPFDFDSVEFLELVGVDAYKIASGDLTNHPLIERVSKLGKPLIISTGASTIDDVVSAYEVASPNAKDLCFLHCVSLYPALDSQLNLQRIKHIQEALPAVVVGFSGHDDGVLGSVIAYGFGARVVEKHFTTDRTLKGTDNAFSLDELMMSDLVNRLAYVNEMIFSKNDGCIEQEVKSASKMMKGIYVRNRLEPGDIVGSGDIEFLSPRVELTPNKAGLVIGMRVRRTIQPGEPILLADLSAVESADTEFSYELSSNTPGETV